MAGISVENLVKEWSTFRAVDDVSFRTEDTEFVALLGPSGCGKSTTLRLIAGLDETTSGTITIDGRNVTGLVPAKRNLSMVFQSYALFPHLTVADNILFGLSVRGVSKADQQQPVFRQAAPGEQFPPQIIVTQPRREQARIDAHRDRRHMAQPARRQPPGQARARAHDEVEARVER